MKQGRRIFALTLAFLLAISGVFGTDTAKVQAAGAKAKKVKVAAIAVTNCNTGSVTIAKGKSFTLKPAVMPSNASNKCMTRLQKLTPTSHSLRRNAMSVGWAFMW